LLKVKLYELGNHLPYNSINQWRLCLMLCIGCYLELFHISLQPNILEILEFYYLVIGFCGVQCYFGLGASWGLFELSLFLSIGFRHLWMDNDLVIFFFLLGCYEKIYVVVGVWIELGGVGRPTSLLILTPSHPLAQF
jgi:hypothetical protein